MKALEVAIIKVSCLLLIRSVLSSATDSAGRSENQVATKADLIKRSITGTVNKSTEFSKQYPLNAFLGDYLGATLRFNASVAKNANLECPVVFIIQQGAQHIESFYLPKNTSYDNNTSRYVHYNVEKTICIQRTGNGENGNSDIKLMISTCDVKDVSFEVLLEGFSKSYITESDAIEKTVVSPTSSRFYPYKFSEGSVNDVVLIEVTSPNDICMTVSVQSPKQGWANASKSRKYHANR